MSTYQKIILLIISIVFLCAGGLCSAFLMEAHGFWVFYGVIMTLLCLLSVGTWIVWLAKPDARFFIKPSVLLIVVIVVVVLAYILGLSGSLDLSVAG